MKKRLLAVLLACCMAAGMANAVFAADELPATAESAAAIAPADPDPPAPEPESEAEPTPAPAPEPEIEAEPTPAADPAATPETARTLVMETLLAAPDTAAQTAVVTSAELVDSIRTDGCFTAKVNGSTDRLDGAVYTWYRSKDGTNWEEVPQQLCSGDAWNITPGSEHRLNAALDACIAGVRDAERLYYKVEVTGTDGAKLTAAAMQVPYCIQLQNGSFETPDIAGLKAYHNKNNNTPASRLYYSPDGGTGTFFTQYPSGEGGIVWQTTGVARHWKTGSAGLYIELADGSNRSYNGTRNYPEASYSIDGAYDGQQFAELNCEAYGALYQDVLTAPGTTLHWSLAHRARGRGMQDSMALLIAPVDVAAQITDILAGVSSEDDNRGLLVHEALDRTVQYNGEDVPIRSFMVGGEITDGNDQWGVHSGDYTVRAGQYVSRFFFLALSSGKGDRREGNLLDKVWFSTEPAPPVAGHANLTLRKTLAGSLTLCVMNLPTIIRTTQESLKTVPQGYREGALGLGAGKWHIIRTIVLPCSIDGIVTGCILAVGRIVGESAALLFTAGAAEVIAGSIAKAYTSNGATLSVLLYLRAFEDGDFASAWGIGAVLLVLVLLIDLAARLAKTKLKQKQ